MGECLLGPDPFLGSVVRHFLIRSVATEAVFDVAVGQCRMTRAHARFISDTTHCPMVTSKSVCRRTVLDTTVILTREQ